MPASIGHSGTKDDNEGYYAAAFAIDLDWDTQSSTEAGSDGKAWLKVNLGKTHCIKQVVWYRSEDDLYLAWTCTTDCSNCEGTGCSYYLLTVSTERSKRDSDPPYSNCMDGDTVKIQRTGGVFSVNEIAIIGKEGEILNC